MLSSRLNQELPKEPEAERFSTRLLRPVAHIAKAVHQLIMEAIKSPLSASLVVTSTVGALTGREAVLVTAAVLSLFIHLETRNHALCLRSPDSSPR